LRHATGLDGTPGAAPPAPRGAHAAE